MCQLENHQGRFSSLRGVWLFSVIFFLWVAPSVAEAVSTAKVNQEASQNFIVSSNDGLVSVMETDASLKDVIERIGEALGIEVEAQVGDHEKVTVEFHDLPIDQAIKRLSGNYAYTSDSSCARVVLLKKSESTENPGRFTALNVSIYLHRMDGAIHMRRLNSRLPNVYFLKLLLRTS